MLANHLLLTMFRKDIYQQMSDNSEEGGNISICNMVRAHVCVCALLNDASPGFSATLPSACLLDLSCAGAARVSGQLGCSSR